MQSSASYGALQVYPLRLRGRFAWLERSRHQQPNPQNLKLGFFSFALMEVQQGDTYRKQLNDISPHGKKPQIPPYVVHDEGSAQIPNHFQHHAD